MTDAQVIECFELVREHSTAMALPLLQMMERTWLDDRNRVRVAKLQLALITGDNVGLDPFAEDDQHSRRVGDTLRSVS